MNLNAVNRSVTLLSRLFDPAKPTQAYLAPTMGKPMFPELPAPYFLRAEPEEEGVSSAATAEFLRKLHKNPDLRMHGITILHNGRIICEASFGAQDVRIPKYTFSACKSIVSLCIGILCGDGKLSTDEKLTDIFSDRVTAVAKMRLGNLSVEDLLTMRTGILFNELESQTDEDWIRGFLNSAITGEPGITFSYNSLNTYMLAAILCRKTGMTLSQFAGQRLFAPLGITDYFWETCPAGIEKGGWGLYLRQEDMAKLATLVLHGGRWNPDPQSGKTSIVTPPASPENAETSNDTHNSVCSDTQIIPEDYLKNALTAHAEAPKDYGDFDYGYQIWVSRKDRPRAWLFNGMLGQNVLIYPDTDTILVSNAGNDELFQTSPYYRIAEDYFAAPDARAFRTNAAAASADAPSKTPRAAADLRLALVEIRQHTEKELLTAQIALAAETAAAFSATTPPPHTSNEKQGGFFAFLRRGRGNKESREPREKTPSHTPAHTHAGTNTSREITVLPPEAAPFLDRTFTIQPSHTVVTRTQDAPDDTAVIPSNAVGLLPVVLQAVQNAYTQGFVSLSFSRTITENPSSTIPTEQLLVTYREQEDTHIFPAGVLCMKYAPDGTASIYGKSIRSTCYFRGIPFRIAASCRFTHDEEHHPVCILTVDFPETPCSRTVKLFLNPTPHANGIPDAVLRQEETPGAGMITRALISQKVLLASQPLIGGTIDKIDNAYLDYRVRRMLAPELELKSSTAGQG